jgi:hypothetical protein
MSYGYEDVNVETLDVSPALRQGNPAAGDWRKRKAHAKGLRVACRISFGDAARTAIAVALAIGIPVRPWRAAGIGQRLYICTIYGTFVPRARP